MGRAALYSDNYFGAEINGLKVMDVKYIPSARIIGSPVETGIISFDNKVNDPAKVVVKGIINIGTEDAEEALSTLRLMMKNRDFYFYSASNGEECYDNLIMESCPEARNASQYDFIECEIVLKEALLISSNTVADENSDFQNGGYISGSVQ